MHALRLANHLPRDRFQVAMAVARGGEPFESRLAADVGFHVLVPGERRSSTGRLLRSVRPLRRLLDREKPDLLLSFLEGPTLAAYRARAQAAHPCAHVAGIQNTISLKWQGQRGARAVFGRLVMSGVRGCYPRLSAVVALSNGVAEDALRLLPELKGRVRVIYNAGYDDHVSAAMHEAVEGKPTDGPLFFACGRLTEQKGFHHLLSAFSRVQGSVPSRLWIAGTGSLRNSLEAHAAELGISERVRFLGFQANPFKYMRLSDVFVLSSLYEGFANVLVEALACGTPVVSTDCPHGPAEILANGAGGVLVPPADEVALAAAMHRVATDRALREVLSRKGIERAEDFHARRSAEAYGRLFDEVLADPRDGRAAGQG